MKFVKLLSVLFLVSFSVAKASAQKKAYIDIDEVVALLPEAQHVNDEVQKFQRDSLNDELKSLVEQYKYLDSLTRIDSVRMPGAVKLQNQQKLQTLSYQIANFQALSEKVLENKRTSLLDPIYAKVYNAVQMVAKENGYAYVLDKSQLIIAPVADDLLPLVAKKLNIKLPEDPKPETPAHQ
jgi:outer membrane protein